MSTPSDGISLGSEHSLAASEHEAKLARYARGRERSLLMADYLRDFSLPFGLRSPLSRSEAAHRADKLSTCGGWLKFRDYYLAGEIRLTSARFCQQDKLCPVCALRRAGRMIGKTADRVMTVMNAHKYLRPYLVTVTVRDGPDLAERYGHLRRGLKTLLMRRKDAARGRCSSVAGFAHGGVWSIELKRGANSGLWHPHSHAVWLCSEAPPAADLSREWKSITGDSHVVDVRPFHHPTEPAADLCEVFKYALKLGELSLHDNVSAWLTVHRRHLIGSFGSLRGVKLPDSLLDDPLEDEFAFCDLLYRHFKGEGYRLTSSYHPHITRHAQEENQAQAHPETRSKSRHRDDAPFSHASNS